MKNSTHRLVLIAMCDNAAGPDAECPGLCWPSNKLIARRCLISDRHVKTIISELCEAGHIVKHRRRRRPDGTLSVWEYVIPYTRGTGRHVDADTRGTGTDSPGEPQRTDQGNPSSPHEPSCETSVEPSCSSSELSLSLSRYEPFDEFWSIYGNLAGSGKKKSRECWDAAMKRGDDPELILEGLRAWVVYWRTPDASKAMYAQGFLNQGKWETPPPPVRDEQQRKVMPGRGGIEAALASRSQRGIGSGS